MLPLLLWGKNKKNKNKNKNKKKNNVNNKNTSISHGLLLLLLQLLLLQQLILPMVITLLTLFQVGGVQGMMNSRKLDKKRSYEDMENNIETITQSLSAVALKSKGNPGGSQYDQYEEIDKTDRKKSPTLQAHSPVSMMYI
jgi:hypothetical protein